MSYATKIYNKQGGDEVVVASGGEINIESGGIISDDGTQASHIADLTVTTDLTGVDTGTDMTATQAGAIATDLAAIETKLNAILAALEGVGILATS